MPIKSFRGLLADGQELRIRLGTIRGQIGYRIKKFKIITHLPGAGSDYASVVKLRTQSLGDGVATTAVVNFDSGLLLGVAWSSGDSATPNNYLETVIFDNVTFNQDIFVTHKETIGSQACNYYLELEQVKLDLNEATVATLKDMRGNYTPKDP